MYKKAHNLRVRSAAAIGLAWFGLSGWAAFDLDRAGRDALQRTESELQVVANVVNTLVVAEEGRIDVELARLRTELRAQGVWAEPGALASPQAEKAAGRVDVKRLESSLRRALASSDGVASFFLVVAGHDGLAALGVDRRDESVRVSDWEPSEGAGIAKALWYADEVSRAVSSSGRQVERGDLAFEGVIERPISRAAIGLHDPGELVQGVLIASVDLSGLSQRLTSVVSSDLRLTLVSVDGRPLDPTLHADAEEGRLPGLAARVLESGGTTGAFEADGLIVLGRPLAASNGGLASAIALVEAELPPKGLAAWVSSPWLPSLVLLAGVSCIAIVGLLRRGGAYAAGARSGLAESSAHANGPRPPEIFTEADSIQVREWLADVRGCLEREAATRGLGLDLRCERSLPNEFRSDAGWLGGLLVAMGREALDATAEERILLEVLEGTDDSLRFEVDAGGVALEPIAGMQEISAAIGARIEPGVTGRLTLVLPAALA